MTTPPVFVSGAILTAAQMNAVGLWLYKTQTISSGATTVTVTGAFSSDYDNYLVTVSNGSLSSNQAIFLRLGSKVTGYRSQLNYAAYANTPLSVGTTTATSFDYAMPGSTTGMFGYMNIGSPFLTQNTFFSSTWNSNTEAGTFVGNANDTTSYTAFTLGAGGGATFTGGTINVYGYTK